MRYIYLHKDDKVIDTELEPKQRKAARLGFIASLLIFVIGIALTIIFNINRYDHLIGSPLSVDVAVYDVRSFQVDSDERNGWVVSNVYKPIGNFTYKGYSCDVALGSGYASEDVAREEIGDIRHIYVDSATLEEVYIAPFNALGVAISGMGLILTLLFTITWTYFSTWSEPYYGRHFDGFKVYSTE